MAALKQRCVLACASLHSAQVFCLLLKTSVQGNSKQLNLFLAGCATGEALCGCEMILDPYDQAAVVASAAPGVHLLGKANAFLYCR